MHTHHRACDHPATPILKEYASKGCPGEVGRNWTLAELEAAVKRGPHVYAMKDGAIAQMQIKAREKAAKGFATIHRWKDLKNGTELEDGRTRSSREART